MVMQSTPPSRPSWRRLRDNCFYVTNLLPIMFVKPKTQNGIFSGKANAFEELIAEEVAVGGLARESVVDQLVVDAAAN